ncbi:MAG: hypothetical protein SGI88_05150 [Candidatus Hydrogenedentes bacterium]|nr:hypothetical protein [Candidatus Hydrogenedentota bacterium]
MSVLSTTTGSRAVLRVADPWQPQQFSGDTASAWRSKYEEFKRKNDGSRAPASNFRDGVGHWVTISESSARVRLSRLVTILKTAGQADTDAFHGIRITEAIHPITRRFGLLPGDVITGIDGVALDSHATTTKTIEAALSRQLDLLRMRALRDGQERNVQIQIRPVKRFTEHGKLPKFFVTLVVNELDQLRAKTEMFERDQRKCAGWMNLPVDGPGIDGLWVIPVAEELTDSTEVKWASVMNQFFSIVNLYPNDHILSLNGVPLTSIDVVLDGIGAVKPALLAGKPYTYVLMVERTPFELVELHVAVE